MLFSLTLIKVLVVAHNATAVPYLLGLKGRPHLPIAELL